MTTTSNNQRPPITVHVAAELVRAALDALAEDPFDEDAGEALCDAFNREWVTRTENPLRRVVDAPSTCVAGVPYERSE